MTFPWPLTSFGSGPVRLVIMWPVHDLWPDLTHRWPLNWPVHDPSSHLDHGQYIWPLYGTWPNLTFTWPLIFSWPSTSFRPWPVCLVFMWLVHDIWHRLTCAQPLLDLYVTFHLIWMMDRMFYLYMTFDLIWPLHDLWPHYILTISDNPYHCSHVQKLILSSFHKVDQSTPWLTPGVKKGQSGQW